MYSRIKHQTEFEHVVFLKGASFTSETLFAQTQRANMYGPTRGNTGRMSTATPFAFLTSSEQNSPRSLGSGSPRTPSVQAHTAPSFHFGAQNGNMKSPQNQHPTVGGEGPPTAIKASAPARGRASGPEPGLGPRFFLGFLFFSFI